MCAVYRLSDHEVLKIYNADKSYEDICLIAKSIRTLNGLGIPVNEIYEIVKTDLSYGIVFEYIEGKTIGELVSNDPKTVKEYGHSIGKLFKQMHKTEVAEDDLCCIKNRLIENIDKAIEKRLFKNSDREYLIAFLNMIPDERKVLHCDFHEGNIMMRDGKTILIDLESVCCGNPLFDLAYHFMNHVLVIFAGKLCKEALGLKPYYALKMYKYTLCEYFAENLSIRIFFKKILPLEIFLVMLNPASLEGSEMIEERKLMKFLMQKVQRIGMMYIKHFLRKGVNPFMADNRIL